MPNATNSNQFHGRLFQKIDIQTLVEKVFQKFDDNKDGRFSRFQFPKVVMSLTNLIGGDTPTDEDVTDLFNSLDINGDNYIDRQEMKILLYKFFDILDQSKIKVFVGKQTDQLY